ncbi:MAG: glycosyl hydrolase family 18 protein [Candidatus Woesebacteria bacterium]|jgi:spore germination protein YaaH
MLNSFTKEIRQIEHCPQKNKSKKNFFAKFGQKKKRLKLLILSIIACFATVAVSLYYFWEIPLLSPLSSLTTFQFLEGLKLPSPQKKIVYGFLPYWNLNKVKIQNETTHLAYFSLGIKANGAIKTKNEEGELEPGFNKLDSDKLMELSNQVRANKGKIEIVLTQFNNDDIVELINDPEAHQKLIASLDSILLAYPISGVNIDIEYTGEVTDKLRENFVIFMHSINQHLKTKYKDIKLSIDMYASAASSKQIWDVEKIAHEVDYIIIMAYDFHRRSSPQAGPVAPLFGGKDLWDTDINSHLKEFVKKVPRQKLILGLAFYGYGWRTTSEDPQAHTYPDTGFTATYAKVKELKSKAKEFNVEEHWHNTALAPYLTYQEEGEHYIIYFENEKSLGYKLEYARQLNLAGIAIWALGYEGDDGDELWRVLRKKL